MQRPQPSLIALAPRADAFHRPPAFRFYLAVHLMKLQVFVLPQLVPPRLKAIKTLFIAPHLATVNPQGCAAERT